MYNRGSSNLLSFIYLSFVLYLLNSFEPTRAEDTMLEVSATGELREVDANSFSMQLTRYDESLTGKVSNNPYRIILDVDPYSKVRPLSCIRMEPECEAEENAYGSHLQHRSPQPDMWRVFTGVMGRYVYNIPVFTQLAGISPLFWRSLNSVILASNSYYFNRVTCNEVTSVIYMQLLAEDERAMEHDAKLKFPNIYKVVVQNYAVFDPKSVDQYDHVFLIVSTIAIPNVHNIKTHSDILMLPQEIQNAMQIVDVYNSRIFIPIHSKDALAMHSGRYCAKIRIEPLMNYKELQLGASKFPGCEGPFLKAMKLSQNVHTLGVEPGAEGKAIIAELEAGKPDKDVFAERYGFS
ncbi:MAG: hypothetical protein K0R66_1349 [Gammaproteobacteria bacterium]|nr:hypothetical protein [Gammaproteobacteria bacterium]